MDLLANALAFVFAGLVTSAAFVYFRSRGHTIAESGAYGLMAMVMLNTWLAQVLLMTGMAFWLFPAQAAILAPAAWMITRRRRLIGSQVRSALAFMRSHPVPCLFMLLAILFLLSTAAALPEADYGRRVVNGFAWPSSPARLIFVRGDQGPPVALPALNHTILLAGWQPSRWAGIASACAFASIGLSTYALARRYAWPQTAITTALLVLSMPRLVHRTLVDPGEILPAAAVLLALLALYRAVEEAHGRDMVMLMAAITFSVSGDRLCYLMPAVLATLSVVILGRRYNMTLWIQAVRRQPGTLMIALAIGIVFSQAGIVLFNLSHGKAWIGAPAANPLLFNSDGIVGAIANMGRYLMQTIHLPGFIDTFCHSVFGFSPLAGLLNIYHATIEALSAGKGAAVPFNLSWTAGSRTEWFGPAGFLLILPSLVYALWRGPRRLKTTALAMVVYWALVALIAAWQPGNARLMTPFFVGSGFCMAFFLPPWRIGRRGLLVMQLLGSAMVAYTLWP